MFWQTVTIRFSNPRKIVRRFRSTLGTRIVFKSFGDPAKVLEKETFEIPENVANNEVLVKVLAAPINPADFNTIQGVYAYKPPLPAVPGLEGFGEIVKIGSKVKSLRVGDRIIPRVFKWTTWKTHSVCQECDVMKVSKDLPVMVGATISVNPPTAYRMLKDFAGLRSGDSVVQNGANSAVGQAVIQIAKDMGVRTINIVRNRTEIRELKDQLKELGADVVLTEEEIRTVDAKELFSKMEQPKLAFNCTGGKAATDMLRLLADNGTIVTYGGMSRQPLIVPIGVLIFRNISAVGFWMSRWKQQNTDVQKEEQMFEYLYGLVADGKFRPPFHQTFSLNDFQRAVDEAAKPFSNKKIILLMEDE